MISRFVSLCLPSIGSCFVMIFRFVSLCLPSTGSCFVMISRFVSLCLPLFAFASLLLDPVSSWFPGLSPFVSLWLLCLPSIGSSSVLISELVTLSLFTGSSSLMISRLLSMCVSPFVSLLLDPRVSLFVSLLTGSSSLMISRLISMQVSLCLPSISFIMISRFVSLCLPSTGSCFVILSNHWFGCLSPFGSLLNSLCKGPFLLWLGGVSYFVFPSFFLAGTLAASIVIFIFMAVSWTRAPQNVCQKRVLLMSHGNMSDNVEKFFTKVSYPHNVSGKRVLQTCPTNGRANVSEKRCLPTCPTCFTNVSRKEVSTTKRALQTCFAQMCLTMCVLQTCPNTCAHVFTNLSNDWIKQNMSPCANASYNTC